MGTPYNCLLRMCSFTVQGHVLIELQGHSEQNKKKRQHIYYAIVYVHASMPMNMGCNYQVLLCTKKTIYCVPILIPALVHSSLESTPELNIYSHFYLVCIVSDTAICIHLFCLLCITYTDLNHATGTSCSTHSLQNRRHSLVQTLNCRLA